MGQHLGYPISTDWRGVCDGLARASPYGGNGVTGEIKELREAADQGKWNTFVMLMGGPETKRKDFPISVAKQWNDKPNRYREPKGDEVIGITREKAVFATRIHQWTVRQKCESNKLKKPVEIKVSSSFSSTIITLHQTGPSLLEYCQ
jgi:hypothetical protein